jgi:hypothetical protein
VPLTLSLSLSLPSVSEIICEMKRSEGDGAGAGKALWENVDGTDGTYGSTLGGEGSTRGHPVDADDYGDSVVVLDRCVHSFGQFLRNTLHCELSAIKNKK